MALALAQGCVQEWLAPRTALIVNIRNSIFGAGLWVAAASASALSLGASRGAVVLGAPVDLSFEVLPDPGSDVASSCVTAQLVAGDTLVGSGKVSVTPLPDLRGRPPAVRVQAAFAVDEPVLTVTLSAGCSGKVTRTYTFLAELPATLPRSTAPLNVARLPAPEPAAGAGAARGARADPRQRPAVPDAAGAAAVPAVPAPSSASAAAPRAVPPVRERKSARPAPAVSAAPPATPSAAQRSDRARLVVEPLDLWVERPVALRTASELSSVPSDQPSAQRAEAAAAWKALNAQPGDTAQQDDRLKALEADVAAVRAQAARDRAEAVRLQQQLAQAENERLPASWLYALAALLVLALLLAAWAWARMRHASEKAVRAWRDSVAALGVHESSVAEHAAALGLPPSPRDAWHPSDDAAVSTAPAPASPAPPPFVSTAPAPSAAAALHPQSGPVPVAVAPAPAAARLPQPTVHVAGPEELFDIQQQAEFFISVGEHQQAIEVLKAHIAERGEVSPLAYLELLRLYHTLSRVEEFSQLRAQFMQSFNAQVPEFSSFHRMGRGLFDYPEALARIEAEWTSPAVLEVLEQFLFRQGDAAAAEPFDLAAYDDLLLLLAIAQTTPASARGAPPPRTRTTPTAPVRAPEQLLDGLPQGGGMASPPPPDSLAASLDFDFDQLLAESGPALARLPADAAAPAQPAEDSRGIPLDLDLSEVPHLTLSDLPPVPVTAPPRGHAVGFGTDNDLMELRLELEQKKKDGQ